jgi:cell shape-determining protein MreC
MPRPHNIFFAIIAIILFAIIIFLPSLGWRLRAWLSPALPQDTNRIAAENEALKADAARYATIARELPSVPQNYIPAMVYARYPANFRSEILVNGGVRAGVAAGKAVVIESATSSYILIGSIEKVFSDTALVQTIFDPRFKMPVRIGPHGYDALFVGGTYPQVASIVKGAAVQVGDVVVSADGSYPYGLPVATIAGVAITPNNLFQEASLNFAYDVNTLQAVLIAR